MIKRIISGGQTGVDRAALDAALALDINCGGWCPRGRRAEDGRVPARYPVTETPTAHYAERTRENVLAADATLIISRGPLHGGTALTARFARELDRPVRVVDLAAGPDPRALARWFGEHEVEVLNVAGPRESGVPGIHARSYAFLCELLAETAAPEPVDPVVASRTPGQRETSGHGAIGATRSLSRVGLSPKRCS